MGHGDVALLSEGPGRILAGRLRLARAGGEAEPLCAIQGCRRRHGAAFHPRAGQGGEADAASPAARLAGIGMGIQPPHSAPHRALHRRRALAAGIHLQLHARPAALRRGRDGGSLRGTHDRCPWLPALRRAGRRLGRVRFDAARLRVSEAPHRDPSQLPAGETRAQARPTIPAGRSSSRTGRARKAATSASRAPSRRRSPMGSPTRRQGWRHGSPRNSAAGATAPSAGTMC